MADLDKTILDTADALPRFAGQKDLYVMVLEKVVADYGQSVQEIRNFLDSGSQADAKFLTHTLKGVMGNVGAKSLFSLYTRLEAALADEPSGENPVSLLDEIAADTEQLFAIIRCGVDLS